MRRLVAAMFAMVGLGGTTQAQASTDGRSPTAFFEYQVDSPVRRLPGNPKPEYPRKLKAARIEGLVVVEYVVDTLGRAEPGSVKFLRSTDSLFSAAVRDALPRMRFVPAEFGRRRVRQVVQEPIRFTLPE